MKDNIKDSSCSSCKGAAIPTASALDAQLARGEAPAPLPSVAQALMPTNLTFDTNNSGVAIATYAPTHVAPPAVTIRRPEIMLPRDEALIIATQPAPRSPIEPRVTISDDFQDRVTTPPSRPLSTTPRVGVRGQRPTVGMVVGLAGTLPIAQDYTLSGITTLANSEVFGGDELKGKPDEDEPGVEEECACAGVDLTWVDPGGVRKTVKKTPQGSIPSMEELRKPENRVALGWISNAKGVEVVEEINISIRTVGMGKPFIEIFVYNLSSPTLPFVAFDPDSQVNSEGKHLRSDERKPRDPNESKGKKYILQHAYWSAIAEDCRQPSSATLKFDGTPRGSELLVVVRVNRHDCSRFLLRYGEPLEGDGATAARLPSAPWIYQAVASLLEKAGVDFEAEEPKKDDDEDGPNPAEWCAKCPDASRYVWTRLSGASIALGKFLEFLKSTRRLIEDQIESGGHYRTADGMIRIEEKKKDENQPLPLLMTFGMNGVAIGQHANSDSDCPPPEFVIAFGPDGVKERPESLLADSSGNALNGGNAFAMANWNGLAIAAGGNGWSSVPLHCVTGKKGVDRCITKKTKEQGEIDLSEIKWVSGCTTTKKKYRKAVQEAFKAKGELARGGDGGNAMAIAGYAFAIGGDGGFGREGGNGGVATVFDVPAPLCCKGHRTGMAVGGCGGLGCHGRGGDGGGSRVNETVTGAPPPDAYRTVVDGLTNESKVKGRETSDSTDGKICRSKKMAYGGHGGIALGEKVGVGGTGGSALGNNMQGRTHRQTRGDATQSLRGGDGGAGEYRGGSGGNAVYNGGQQGGTTVTTRGGNGGSASGSKTRGQRSMAGIPGYGHDYGAGSKEDPPKEGSDGRDFTTLNKDFGCAPA